MDRKEIEFESERTTKNTHKFQNNMKGRSRRGRIRNRHVSVSQDFPFSMCFRL